MSKCFFPLSPTATMRIITSWPSCVRRARMRGFCNISFKFPCRRITKPNPKQVTQLLHSPNPPHPVIMPVALVIISVSILIAITIPLPLIPIPLPIALSILAVPATGSQAASQEPGLRARRAFAFIMQRVSPCHRGCFKEDV